MLKLDRLSTFLAFMCLLEACTSAGVSLGVRLGLPEDTPAFLFFYTDN